MARSANCLNLNLMVMKEKLMIGESKTFSKAESLIARLIEHSKEQAAVDLRATSIESKGECKEFNIAFFDNLTKHTKQEFEDLSGDYSSIKLLEEAEFEYKDGKATLKINDCAYNIYPITVGQQTLRDFLDDQEQSNGKEIPKSFEVQKFEGEENWDQKYENVKFDMAFCDVEETLSFKLSQLTQALTDQEKFDALFGNDFLEELFKEDKTDLDRFNKIKEEGLLKNLMYKEVFNRIKEMKKDQCQLSILSSAFDIENISQNVHLATIDSDDLAKAIKESLLNLYCEEFDQEKIEIITEDGKVEVKESIMKKGEVEFLETNSKQSEILLKNQNSKKENQTRAKSLKTVTEYIDAIIELEKTISCKVIKDKYYAQYLSDLESLKKIKKDANEVGTYVKKRGVDDKYLDKIKGLVNNGELSLDLIEEDGHGVRKVIATLGAKDMVSYVKNLNQDSPQEIAAINEKKGAIEYYEELYLKNFTIANALNNKVDLVSLQQFGYQLRPQEKIKPESITVPSSNNKEKRDSLKNKLNEIRNKSYNKNPIAELEKSANAKIKEFCDKNSEAESEYFYADKDGRRTDRNPISITEQNGFYEIGIRSRAGALVALRGLDLKDVTQEKVNRFVDERLASFKNKESSINELNKKEEGVNESAKIIDLQTVKSFALANGVDPGDILLTKINELALTQDVKDALKNNNNQDVLCIRRLLDKDLSLKGFLYVEDDKTKLIIQKKEGTTNDYKTVERNFNGGNAIQALKAFYDHAIQYGVRGFEGKFGNKFDDYLKNNNEIKSLSAQLPQTDNYQEVVQKLKEIIKDVPISNVSNHDKEDFKAESLKDVLKQIRDFNELKEETNPNYYRKMGIEARLLQYKQDKFLSEFSEQDKLSLQSIYEKFKKLCTEIGIEFKEGGDVTLPEGINTREPKTVNNDLLLNFVRGFSRVEANNIQASNNGNLNGIKEINNSFTTALNLEIPKPGIHPTLALPVNNHIEITKEDLLNKLHARYKDMNKEYSLFSWTSIEQEVAQILSGAREVNELHSDLSEYKKEDSNQHKDELPSLLKDGEGFGVVSQGKKQISGNQKLKISNTDLAKICTALEKDSQETIRYKLSCINDRSVVYEEKEGGDLQGFVDTLIKDHSPNNDHPHS